MSKTADIKPRFIAGSATPIGPDRDPHPNPEPLLPPDVQMVCRSIEISDYTIEGVNEAIAERYWPVVDAFVKDGAHSIMLQGFPVASQLGRARVLELQAETTRRTGLIADSHAEATIAAIRLFGAKRIAIASRWSDQLNTALVEYLQAADLEILTITGVGQWAKQAFSMSIDEGVKLSFELAREAMRKAPKAELLLLPGGAWRSLAAVPILENDYGIPVVTNPIAEVWRLIDMGVAPPVKGWGRLLASPARGKQ